MISWIRNKLWEFVKHIGEGILQVAAAILDNINFGD